MALNEVGGEPEHFGTGVETFDHPSVERVRRRPGAGWVVLPSEMSGGSGRAPEREGER